MQARLVSTSCAAVRQAMAQYSTRGNGQPAVLPGPAPKEGDKFPPNKKYYEIPIAIQDRAFNFDGSLFYPDSRAFFDGITGPYIPNSDISPIWNPPSSATPSWSTATRGRSKPWSSAATGSASSMAAMHAS